MSGVILLKKSYYLLYIYTFFLFFFACWYTCINVWTNVEEVLVCGLLQTLKCTQTHTFSWVHMHLLSACMSVCVCAGVHTRHFQTPNSITDELLPAHDKSPPVCGISVVAHVGARPDPTASALSPTTWGPAWTADWLMGESRLTKKLKWLITEAHLSTWGARRAKHCGAQEGAPLLGLSTWHPGADSPVHGSV